MAFSHSSSGGVQHHVSDNCRILIKIQGDTGLVCSTVHAWKCSSRSSFRFGQVPLGKVSSMFSTVLREKHGFYSVKRFLTFLVLLLVPGKTVQTVLEPDSGLLTETT